MNLERSLAETEKQEKQNILSQLDQYHQARRKYLMEASAMVTTGPNLHTEPSHSLSNACATRYTTASSNVNLDSSYPGVSLAIPPFPEIRANNKVDVNELERCCDYAYHPISSSTFQSSKRSNRRAKSSATSTSDLKNDTVR